MTLGSAFLGLALLLLVGLYVGRPLLVADKPRHRRIAARWRLSAQKDALLAQISSLDFDYETGKIPPNAYQEQRKQLMSEAAGVLRKLDKLDAAAAVTGQAEIDVPAGQDLALGADIEAAVARFRGIPVATVPAGDNPVARSGNGKGGFCPQCGEPADSNDKFCAYCGQNLKQSNPA